MLTFAFETLAHSFMDLSFYLSILVVVAVVAVDDAVAVRPFIFHFQFHAVL